MKLFKYPYLIQKEILENVEPSCLFLLSFVSKNVKKLIKSSLWKRFGSIEFIRYDCDYEEQLKAYVLFGHSSLEKILRCAEHKRSTVSQQVCAYTCPWAICLWKPEEIVKQEDPHNDYFQLNVLGVTIDFQISKQGDLVSMFHEGEKEMVIQSIHNYFLDFFGSAMEYQWMARGYTHSIPRLQNLSSCFDMTIVDLEWEDDENLEDFFAYCPVWKCINIHFPCMYDIFTPESKLHLAESVKISQHFSNSVLSHFQGKQLVINHTFCKFSELVAFVNKWKSGESFHKLEYLRIQKNLLEIPQTHFFNEIGAKYIPATKIPPIHTLPKVHVEDDRELNTDPIITHAYVVRETDNRVASVMIQGKTMSFGVWDMTEEEFLSMVDYFQIYFVGRILSS